MAAAPAHAKAHRLTKLPSDAGFVVMGGVVVLPEGAGIEVMGGEVVAASLVQLILT